MDSLLEKTHGQYIPVDQYTCGPNTREQLWIFTWYLVVIDADTVELRIPIEEHAELQQWIWTVLNAWNHGSR